MARILGSQPDMRVVAHARDGRAAVDGVAERRGTRDEVDVLVLDLEMPVMDGLTALALLLRIDPTLQVLISSAVTRPGARATMRALALGAADYVTKPSATSLPLGISFEERLIAKISGLGRLRREVVNDRYSAPRQVGQSPFSKSMDLMVIGSSTGGPRALCTLLSELGVVAVPIVIAQHMTSVFTPLLAEHIDSIGGMPCTEVRHGEALLPGRIYVAQGGNDLFIAATRDGLAASIIRTPTGFGCHPSIDTLLHSAALARPGLTLAVILTGMGCDGLSGTQAVVAGGGIALAQDEATSVVWGMPGAISRAGLAETLPLNELAAAARRVLGTASITPRGRGFTPSHLVP